MSKQSSSDPAPSGKVYPLKDNQMLAVEPRDSVWLSASAGTGKTQVLSARVLRLLLREDVRPEQILCLTFTKAGAAEMATRVNDVLANWVRMKPEALGKDLLAIGAGNDADTLQRARSLFAHVLDCPGGGLRIDTIHAFAQWLLAAFPEEAGLDPGTQPMEDRDRELLAHRVLVDLLEDWESSGDDAAMAALENLATLKDPDWTRKWLMRCAMAEEAWFGPGAWQPPMAPRVRSLLGVADDLNHETIAANCNDHSFAIASLLHWRSVLADWGTATAQKVNVQIDQWIAGDAQTRLDQLGTLRSALFTQKGDVRSLSSLEKIDPGFAEVAERVRSNIETIHNQLILLDLVELTAPALEIGRKFALAWDAAKKREGLIDFDDLIRQAAGLLKNADLGDWIRYKLDRRFDHILVDEAQDTNEAQWSILDALTGDFFTGLGQRDNRLRTIFVVGDYKQAIFRFQGTSPENFEAAKNRYKKRLAQRDENARSMRENIDARELVELGLGRSFRTSQNVLNFVDEAIAVIEPENIGLKQRPDPHIGADRAGLVRMWKPVLARDEDDDDASGNDRDGDGGPETWVSAPERRMADKIARQVRQWMDRGFPLVKGETPRNAGPGDVMVLVRKRKELAGLIVARLHAAGVPVAGVDRLRLGAPLAVQDLMAALRFASQPDDSLSLAALLVSPIFGWSQAELLQYGYRKPDKGKTPSLWEHLRKSSDPRAVEAADMLRALLRMADFGPPQDVLHWILLGPWQGRRQLTARLGAEANDPIDELLNAALSFSSKHTASLHGFIQWFDAGEGEVKREAGEAGNQVRVMTVHGSKGLEAPIVILADATGNPDNSLTRGLALEEQLPGGGGKRIPIPDLRKEMKIGPIKQAEETAQREEREEHWRLLYVAMTRAEEALFIGGALGKSEKEPAEDSWYARLAPLFEDAPKDDPIWGEHWQRGSIAAKVLHAQTEAQATRLEIPDWALTPIGDEPRPPKPLAPSSAGEEQGADPPLPADQAAMAARRGTLMHSLLERLPDCVGVARSDQGGAWLDHHAADLAEAERADMLARVLAVLDDPQWAELFGPDALAEVPLAAIVDGQVIAGTADRLIITDEAILIADFKTARRPPQSLADIPNSTLKQMGAYAAALQVIYPAKRVEAAVLYTQTPQLITIPAEILAANKPALPPMQ